jgi:hypothetical protein
VSFTIPYSGELPWLVARTILFARHGSHAYGLATEGSDEDFKGVAIPPKEYFFGFVSRFEQAESKTPDMVVFDLRKFMSLAADCNPNIIEVLWTEPLVVTPLGERLRASRGAFLSKKAKHTFSGYALAQLKRIRTHHRWIANAPKAPPTRAEYGLPERTLIPKDQLAAAQAAIDKKLAHWELHFVHEVDPASRILLQNKMAEALAEMKVAVDDKWAAAARTLGYDENFLALLDRERRYTAAQRDWEQYQHWKATRNPKRAALEERHLYDTKHAMHLVRLLRMCREILTTGEVVVKRPDREELLAIRNGAWTYEQLVEHAEKEDEALDALYQSSPLPKAPDRAALDALCVELVEASFA